jgi:hypothetical protein
MPTNEPDTIAWGMPEFVELQEAALVSRTSMISLVRSVIFSKALVFSSAAVAAVLGEVAVQAVLREANRCRRRFELTSQRHSTAANANCEFLDMKPVTLVRDLAANLEPHRSNVPHVAVMVRWFSPRGSSSFSQPARRVGDVERL